MKTKDTLFSEEPEKQVQTFRFDENVANVFDDMAERSVPFYHYQQEMAAKITRYFHQPGTAVYDIGCATGATLAEIRKTGPSDANLIGVDSSQAMLAKAREKGLDRVTFELSKVEDMEIQGASVVLMLYTLQFTPFDNRANILKKVYAGLLPGGCFIMCEKVKPAAPAINGLFEKAHEEFKEENEYSRLEIEKKKKALKGYLVPATVEQNLNLLNEASFHNSEIFFKALNFCGFLGLKAK